MAWTVYCVPYSTAAMTDASIYQYFKPENNIILTALRAWIVQVDDPAYTSINMKIYSNSGGLPRTLIATSTNSQTKAAMFSTSNSGVKEVYFNFSPLVLKQDETYHAVINASGYTGTSTSHLAWRQMLWEPVYRTGYNATFGGASVSPLGLTVIGAKL